MAGNQINQNTRKLKRNSTLKQSEKRTAVSNIIGKLTLKEMHLNFMRFKRAEGLAPRTIDGYEETFGYLLDYLGRNLTKKEMTTDLFVAYKDFMINDKGYSPHTVNVRIRTLHTFLKFCFEEGYILEPIHIKIKPIKAPIDNVDALEPHEIKTLLAVLDDDWFTQYRDKVIILTMLDTMARIGELFAVKRTNVDLKHGSIYLEGDTVKTRQGRTLPLSYRTTKLLGEYIEETSDFNSEYLFVTYDGRQLNESTFRIKLREYAEKAGIKKQVSPHVFRHTGALLYLLNAGDPFSLQKILGHKDISMTRRYVQMTQTNVKDQHELYSPLNAIFNKNSRK
ncbi:tyrosine-type recombinase/integrase [Peribacillus acanthi]|uniref:tyrosine-type recombinase/integrase n=1 Tax=Peribacillus acanthi TaxID=2171554 RepID=UPI000D3E875B|nr:tyrosine-type recombinase/integrase [Peribacillus acanthi]